jgi:threonine/homoserine/homoserine lactone efflux protein
MIRLLLKGLVIGFSIAAPVGPIGVLCIRRALTEGRSAGFSAGLGAATADAVYGCIAGFGVTFVSGFLVDQEAWIRLIGGLFLCYLGARAFSAEPAAGTESAQGSGLMAVYGSTFLLTLTNPMTILSFAAVFAGLGAAETARDYGAAIVLVLGVFVGSVLWWFALSGVVSLFRERFDVYALRWVNRISGVVLAGFGVVALVSLL